jgi:hypothetical protein
LPAETGLGLVRCCATYRPRAPFQIYRLIELLNTSRAILAVRRYAKRCAMVDRLIGLEQYRLKVEECVAMAKSSASNKARANHYAQAQHYLRLFEEGSKLDGDPKNRR